MKSLNRTTSQTSIAPRESVLQFGGGNFLRAFVDWILAVYHDTTGKDLGIVVVPPTGAAKYAAWRKQEGLFHVLTKGVRNGEIVEEARLITGVARLIDVFSEWTEYLASAEQVDLRYIVSNTTEAGIRFSDGDQLTDMPPKEFPAKLTAWLWHRYHHFSGAPEAGCVFLPVELIDRNGEALKDCILQYADHWNLAPGFSSWIQRHNFFCNSLVDRIVPGVAPEDRPEAWKELGFRDEMITQGEVFHFWAIEAPEAVRRELPLDQIGLNIVFVDDLAPFRNRKVRILNGAHTAMVPVGYLYGKETVRQVVEDELLGQWIDQLLEREIIPTIPLPKEELRQFADDVLDRFRNPFIHHELLSISLNSFSKYASRILPTLLDYQERENTPPKGLVLALAALIHFYRGIYRGREIPLRDEEWVKGELAEGWGRVAEGKDSLMDLSTRLLAWEAMWSRDLNSVPGLTKAVGEYLDLIDRRGIGAAIRASLTKE